VADKSQRRVELKVYARIVEIRVVCRRIFALLFVYMLCSSSINK